MAAKDNRKRGEVAEPSRWSNEITGILWMTGGLLLLLSLVKYSPADLPRAGPLEAFASKNGTAGENLIGPVGGVLASFATFAVTFFVTGNGFTTLSVEIYSLARQGISMKINALSTVIFLFTFLLVIGYYFLNQRAATKLSRPEVK